DEQGHDGYPEQALDFRLGKPFAQELLEELGGGFRGTLLLGGTDFITNEQHLGQEGEEEAHKEDHTHREGSGREEQQPRPFFTYSGLLIGLPPYIQAIYNSSQRQPEAHRVGQIAQRPHVVTKPIIWADDVV